MTTRAGRMDREQRRLAPGQGVGDEDRRLRHAHEQFVTSQTAPGFVRPVVAGSWRRCAAARVSPDESELPPVRLVADELEQHRRAHPMAALLPLFRELLGDSAADDGHIWAVGDADGILLWVEGDLTTRRRAERMNFVAGAAWGEALAGTNAPGTALELGRDVQIRGPEHYMAAVQPWSCSAVPVRDPHTGDVFGVIDVTGDSRVATRQSLAVVRATARAAEAELARRWEVADGVARERYLRRLERDCRPLALVAPRGRVLHAAAGIATRHLADLAPGRAQLADGRAVVVERVVRGSGYLLVCAAEDDPQPTTAAVGLRALGTDAAELRVTGRSERLSPRHSEIMVALLLAGCGVSGERLGLDLYGDDIHPVTLRAEMSRLRALLGPDVLGSRPYELRRQVRTDFGAVRALLAAGEVAEALTMYTGPLLPSSEAPAIIEFRTVLEQQLRAAVLASHDPALLRRWVDTPWGADDIYAWEMLVRHLPAGSPQQAAAAVSARFLGR
jgi:hypothetical protein